MHSTITGKGRRMADTAVEFQQLSEKARITGQEHVFRWWGNLDERGRRKLLYQLGTIDFDLVQTLISKYLHNVTGKFQGVIEPTEVIYLPQTDEQVAQRRRMAELGAEAIRRGEVCLFIVAGGQGTRLRYDPPKGTYPICPLSRKSLFQVFAEKLIATSRRYDVTIPLYVMTSTINNNATQEFFRINHFFGLGKRNVMFVMQEMVPSVDFDGKIILKNKDEIAVNPNGHGGSIKALYDNQALEDMQSRKIKYISYHQVDNVLVRSIDPVFIGYHIAADAEMSLKVLRKRNAEEKLGVVGKIDGRTRVIEYCDIGPEMMYATNPDGSLKYGTGSIAIHIMNVDFLLRENREGFSLPYHAAKKIVPCIGDSGEPITPAEPNGIKFETFVFDALRDARRSVVLETDRSDEFAPLKNAAGDDSPVTARQALSNAHGRWLRMAGIDVPTDGDGNLAGVIEIGPLFALDPEELAAKVASGILPRDIKFNGQLLLQEESTTI